MSLGTKLRILGVATIAFTALIVAMQGGWLALIGLPLGILAWEAFQEVRIYTKNRKAAHDTPPQGQSPSTAARHSHRGVGSRV